MPNSLEHPFGDSASAPVGPDYRACGRGAGLSPLPPAVCFGGQRRCGLSGCEQTIQAVWECGVLVAAMPGSPLSPACSHPPGVSSLHRRAAAAS